MNSGLGFAEGELEPTASRWRLVMAAWYQPSAEMLASWQMSGEAFIWRVEGKASSFCQFFPPVFKIK